MPNIPFSAQILPTNYLVDVQVFVRDGKRVSGEDLLLAIEQSIQQQLPEPVRKIVGLAIIPAVKTRGRPPKFDASLDLALNKVDHRYPPLLRYEKRKKKRLLKSGKAAQKGNSPSLLAYGRLLRHMKDDFGPMTPEALRNVHWAYRKGRFHPAENDTDSEEYEAAIERRFPLEPE
jgi:hypothetical protein